METREYEALGRGQRASIVLDNLAPSIQKLREMTINKLKGLYRSGDHDPSKSMAGIAYLCALDDIINDLKGDVKRAEKIIAKEQS